MGTWNKWEHLFLNGEFSDRDKVLAGLKLQDVVKRPDNVKNSIYDELWHMTMWQNNIVLNDDEKDSDEKFKMWDKDVNVRFPGNDPGSQKEWDELVESYLNGLNKVIKWSQSAEKLQTRNEDGFSVKDSLYSLAIHNAYHIGKIVSLRQQLGLWPPLEK